MQKTIFLAMLCLLMSGTINARQTSKSDSLQQLENYLIDDSVLIKTKDGATISALVVRKKNVQEPQATILLFTIYARKTDFKKAVQAADNGYVGVVAYTRGKRYSPDEAIP